MTKYDEFQESKTLEDRVVSVVYHQTSGPQHETVPESTVLTILSSHADENSEAVRMALDSAVESGRVVSADGRYALADDESRPAPDSI
jgi:hypothetical protein